MELTRSQILKRFDLKIRTLDTLVGLGILHNQFESKDGKRVLNVTPDDVLALESARNSISSFGYGSVSKGRNRGIKPLPFHRFLILRFINTPVDEVYDELFQLELLTNPQKFTLADLKKIYDRFIDRLPTGLKKLVKKRMPPKTKKDKKLYEIFLRVNNVQYFYLDPALVDSLYFFLNIRRQVEIFLSTQSTAVEVSEFLSKQLNIDIDHKYVHGYKLLFYAVHELQSEDLEVYHQIIPPSEKRAKKLAAPKKIEQYAITQGLETKNVTQVLEEIRAEAQKDIFNLKKLKTAAGAQALRAALDRFLKADQRIEDLTGGDNYELAKIFDSFKIVHSDQSSIISIEEARAQVTADGS